MHDVAPTRQSSYASAARDGSAGECNLDHGYWWRELEMSVQSVVCAVQWFISQVSTSPSIWLFRRWVEG